jgi:hypothetical protein
MNRVGPLDMELRLVKDATKATGVRVVFGIGVAPNSRAASWDKTRGAPLNGRLSPANRRHLLTPIKTLVAPALAAQRRRGRDAVDDGLDSGRINVKRLGGACRAAVVAVSTGSTWRSTSAWLRPDAPTPADRLFSPRRGRARQPIAQTPKAAGISDASYVPA